MATPAVPRPSGTRTPTGRPAPVSPSSTSSRRGAPPLPGMEIPLFGPQPAVCSPAVYRLEENGRAFVLYSMTCIVATRRCEIFRSGRLHPSTLSPGANQSRSSDHRTSSPTPSGTGSPPLGLFAQAQEPRRQSPSRPSRRRLSSSLLPPRQTMLSAAQSRHLRNQRSRESRRQALPRHRLNGVPRPPHRTSVMCRCRSCCRTWATRVHPPTGSGRRSSDSSHGTTRPCE